MPVVAFMNMKGGVAKTTLCVNLAYTLAKQFDKRVLLIDLDPQFNASQSVMAGEDYINFIKNKKTSYNIFLRDTTVPDTVKGTKKKQVEISKVDDVVYVVPGTNNKFHLVPSRLELMKLANADRGVELRLKRFIEKFGLNESYDYIFVDCPPTASFWTTSAILSSEYYILPVKPDYLSSVGISLFETALNDVTEEFGHKIKCAGVVFTMVEDKTKLAQEVMDSIRTNKDFTGRVFTSYLRRSTRIAAAAKRHCFILDVKDYNNDILKIAREFNVKLGESE